MIRVQEEDFDVGVETAALRKGRADIGAIAAFIGLVRDHAKSGEVAAMTLEHYPGMTENELSRIEREAHARWPHRSSRWAASTWRQHRSGHNIVGTPARCFRSGAIPNGLSQNESAILED